MMAHTPPPCVLGLCAFLRELHEGGQPTPVGYGPLIKILIAHCSSKGLPRVILPCLPSVRPVPAYPLPTHHATHPHLSPRTTSYTTTPSSRPPLYAATSSRTSPPRRRGAVRTRLFRTVPGGWVGRVRNGGEKWMKHLGGGGAVGRGHPICESPPPRPPGACSVLIARHIHQVASLFNHAVWDQGAKGLERHGCASHNRLGRGKPSAANAVRQECGVAGVHGEAAAHH